MKKLVFTAFAVGLSLTANFWAQVPSYVPTNGLVGWWPFNGNANDESGNGNNGTVNGATLTADRNGNSNKAFSFNGQQNIIINDNSNLTIQNGTISVWFLTNSLSPQMIIAKRNIGTADSQNFTMVFYNNELTSSINYNSNCQATGAIFCNSLGNYSNVWINLTTTISSDSIKTYVNGQQVNSVIAPNSFADYCAGSPILIGRTQDIFDWFNGKIDDIGIWNRALTAQEINTLYNGCGNEIITQPSNAINTLGANAQFSVNTVAGGTYQWQSNPSNFGWQNVPSNTNYSGGTTNTLTVSNTTVSNHNQPFRAIVNTGGCIDTSDVANIIIGDTCLTTVTDTLIINTTLSLPAPNNANTILIYPNPASDHITIDNGNYAAMAGYTIKIENNAGQQVFQSLINQAQFYVDLSTWSGNGLYFVHFIDPQNNTVTIRKIVLQ